MVRFLNDQQSILLGYLYIDAEGDHCVVLTPYFYEDNIRKSFYEDMSIKEVMENTYFCAPSFEEFIYRFWIENTLWYSITDSLKLSPIEKEYLDVVEKNL